MEDVEPSSASLTVTNTIVDNGSTNHDTTITEFPLPTCTEYHDGCFCYREREADLARELGHEIRCGAGLPCACAAAPDDPLFEPEREMLSATPSSRKRERCACKCQMLHHAEKRQKCCGEGCTCAIGPCACPPDAPPCCVPFEPASAVSVPVPVAVRATQQPQQQKNVADSCCLPKYEAHTVQNMQFGTQTQPVAVTAALGSAVEQSVLGDEDRTEMRVLNGVTMASGNMHEMTAVQSASGVTGASASTRWMSPRARGTQSALNKGNADTVQIGTGASWTTVTGAAVGMSAVTSRDSNRSVERVGESNHGNGIVRRERPYACSICGSSFLFKQNRDRHVVEVHRGARPHSCTWPNCGAAFKNTSGLKQHMKTVHDKERPFKCAQCGASFGQRNHLTQHVLVVHERKKMFQCRICSTSFSNRGNLNQHLKRRHSGANNVSPPCPPPTQHLQTQTSLQPP